MNGLIRHSVHYGCGGAGGRGGWSGPCGPGRSMSGAPVRSRSVTFSSLAASSASVMACRYRRRPFLGEHRPPWLPRLPRRVHRDPALHLRHHTGGIADGLAGVPADAGQAAPAAGRLAPPGACQAARPRPGGVGFRPWDSCGDRPPCRGVVGFLWARKRPLTYLTNRLRHPGTPTSGAGDHSPMTQSYRVSRQAGDSSAPNDSARKIGDVHGRRPARRLHGSARGCQCTRRDGDP